MSERLCEKCQEPQEHRVFETLPPFLPPEQAMQKRKWQELILEHARGIVRQGQAEDTATMQALKKPRNEREMRNRLITDPQIVHMQKCLADLAIFETPRMLQTWSCQPKNVGHEED